MGIDINTNTPIIRPQTVTQPGTPTPAGGDQPGPQQPGIGGDGLQLTNTPPAAGAQRTAEDTAKAKNDAWAAFKAKFPKASDSWKGVVDKQVDKGKTAGEAAAIAEMINKCIKQFTDKFFQKVWEQG